MPGTPRDDRPPLAIAMEWVSRIIAVALMMVLPGLGGQWLDNRLGTGFLALAGFAFGIAAGIYHLLQMTKSASERGSGGPRSGSNRSAD